MIGHVVLRDWTACVYRVTAYICDVLNPLSVPAALHTSLACRVAGHCDPRYACTRLRSAAVSTRGYVMISATSPLKNRFSSLFLVPTMTPCAAEGPLLYAPLTLQSSCVN